ncbi:MAG: toll/interleukin-1 receptor domain-containing protein, partial [candidate division Zixibacteria bacterium]|nr:toll/interleukin-1 receptor domain-containing protein [candidate division Zixibacteria bacterium]
MEVCVYLSQMGMLYDIFICHASEDKDDLVRPLAALLETHHLFVWYDEFTLQMGDSLSRSIDIGLSRSRFGIVVLSPNFFSKQWPQRELGGLVARETLGSAKVILPIWHKINKEDICSQSPPLADVVAVSS